MEQPPGTATGLSLLPNNSDFELNEGNCYDCAFHKLNKTTEPSILT